MKPEFKAEVGPNGKLIVKPVIERKGKHLIIHLPSIPLITKTIKEHGKRNLQQIQGKLDE